MRNNEEFNGLLLDLFDEAVASDLTNDDYTNRYADDDSDQLK